ncbi:MAG: hypothetical protein R3B09_32265 [Nannocystaceae bacterium]
MTLAEDGARLRRLRAWLEVALDELAEGRTVGDALVDVLEVLDTLDRGLDCGSLLACVARLGDWPRAADLRDACERLRFDEADPTADALKWARRRGLRLVG